jgi:hypothetical protein
VEKSFSFILYWKSFAFFQLTSPHSSGIILQFPAKGKRKKSVIEKVESIEKLSALLACGLS